MGGRFISALSDVYVVFVGCEVAVATVRSDLSR